MAGEARHPCLFFVRHRKDVDGRPPAFAAACFADHDDWGLWRDVRHNENC